jgi:hexosaminidase
MYLRLQKVSLQLEAVGLTHLSYKEPLMRLMTKGYDTKALAVLAAVLEPLKIYERNQGDTMYSVFSPFTKIADLATPDQEVPRLFKEQISAYLRKPDANLENEIRNWLLLWKNNDAELIPVFKQAPLLDEALMLSKNLSLLGATGLESLQYINENRNPGAAWLRDKLGLLQQARQQAGRCELQIVDPIQQLVERAGAIQ